MSSFISSISSSRSPVTERLRGPDSTGVARGGAWLWGFTSGLAFGIVAAVGFLWRPRQLSSPPVLDVEAHLAVVDRYADAQAKLAASQHKVSELEARLGAAVPATDCTALTPSSSSLSEAPSEPVVRDTVALLPSLRHVGGNLVSPAYPSGCSSPALPQTEIKPLMPQLATSYPPGFPLRPLDSPRGVDFVSYSSMESSCATSTFSTRDVSPCFTPYQSSPPMLPARGLMIESLAGEVILHEDARRQEEACTLHQSLLVTRSTSHQLSPRTAPPTARRASPRRPVPPFLRAVDLATRNSTSLGAFTARPAAASKSPHSRGTAQVISSARRPVVKALDLRSLLSPLPDDKSPRTQTGNGSSPGRDTTLLKSPRPQPGGTTPRSTSSTPRGTPSEVVEALQAHKSTDGSAGAVAGGAAHAATPTTEGDAAQTMVGISMPSVTFKVANRAAAIREVNRSSAAKALQRTDTAKGASLSKTPSSPKGPSSPPLHPRGTLRASAGNATTEDQIQRGIVDVI